MNGNENKNNPGAKKMNLIDITDMSDTEIDALFNAPKVVCPDCGATCVATPEDWNGNNGPQIRYTFNPCACGSDLEGAEWF